MPLLKEYLEKQNKCALFLSLDFEVDQQFFSSQRNLINKIQLELGKGKGYVFIDEVQRKADAGPTTKSARSLPTQADAIAEASVHRSRAGHNRCGSLALACKAGTV